ncbi:PREDICTED: protein grindelwald isoform X2 [Polistes dominula]|uniref:Protein grindelwald isoform X2 n=1 Tax=Polistes dominula TaxID=743375 RepID=A0ABM1I5C4_POLDO|nr:PREDICTED: protein grindelwald isoform X2 [Polistes dominula]
MSHLSTIIIFGLCTLSSVVIGLNLNATKCGTLYCTSLEYCSAVDTLCRPCSTICNPDDRNHQPEDCRRDCQEYIYDQRYALRKELNQYALREELNQYDQLREVDRLRILLSVTLTLTCLAIMVIVFLLIKTFIRCDKIGNAIRNVFSKKWVKKATNNNKVQDDVENGNVKNNNPNNNQNNLKLTMPTISATVSSSEDNSNSNSTPNTTSTPLSRRHPSEDTTLDYAYDNPAMTPSPEAAQLRTKRESSF